MTDELKPCPFCGSEIKHVESWAKSFTPPRLYHEWHHEQDNPESCPVRRHVGKIVASASDDIGMQNDAVCRWNTRAHVCGVAQEPADNDLPAWEDTRVQIAYELLCSDKMPPNPEEHWEGYAARRIVAALAALPAEGADDWEDDPAADERWTAGCNFAMEQLCGFLGVEVGSVSWDAATETVEGDVSAVIGNILRAKFGDDWGPNEALAVSAPSDGAIYAAVSQRDLTPEARADIERALLASGIAELQSPAACATEKMARENDAEFARLTGIIFDLAKPLAELVVAYQDADSPAIQDTLKRARLALDMTGSAERRSQPVSDDEPDTNDGEDYLNARRGHPGTVKNLSEPRG